MCVGRGGMEKESLKGGEGQADFVHARADIAFFSLYFLRRKI